MHENGYDWSRFVKRIPVKAPIQAIYDAWATSKGLESWFLRSAEYKTVEGKVLSPAQPASANDTYTWYWHGWDDNTVERGKVLEANGKNHFRFVFGKEGIVTVKIKEEHSETVVELLQEEIPADEKHRVLHLGCSTGWTFYLASLKSVLEGGIDLRNKNTLLREVVNS